jgi:amino-acid N-acetyltransferase
VHKVSARRLPSTAPRRRARTHLSATHVARAAIPADAIDVHQLLSQFAGEGQLLPRSLEAVEAGIRDYVVIVDRHERVMGCATLLEYSPSVAEVGAVAVSREAHGLGLGTLAVRTVEAVARRRGIPVLFAMSRAARFFESLGYEEASVDQFPEKVAQYHDLAARGIAIAPKGCFRKFIG